MNVKELLDELGKWPEEAEVVLQKDAEGNDYSPLVGAEGNVLYVAESSWSGNCVHIDDEPDYINEDGSLEPDMSRVVVLWPVN